MCEWQVFKPKMPTKKRLGFCPISSMFEVILDCWLLDILLYGRKGLLFSMFIRIRFCVSLKIVH
jgi:hypothetical protein